MRALAVAATLAVLPVPATAQELITLDLTLSPRAMSDLAARAEMVLISGFYWGEPAPGATIEPDGLGQIFLGHEEHVVWPVPQRVRLGANRGGMQVTQVTVPMLTVNGFSARYADADNLLDCSMVDGTLSDLTGPVHAMHCKLIGE